MARARGTPAGSTSNSATLICGSLSSVIQRETSPHEAKARLVPGLAFAAVAGW